MNNNLNNDIVLHKGRDFSPYLFHFVKGKDPMLVLETILYDNALKSQDYPFISYTESPLMAMAYVLNYFQKYKNTISGPLFQPYGIGLKREMMFVKYNARPVIYGTENERKMICKSLLWRFELMDMKQRDYSWQREWRTEGNIFELPEDKEEIVIICRIEKEVDQLKKYTDFPIVSFEWQINNHATDFDVEAYSFLQSMSEDEIELARLESEELQGRDNSNEK